MSIIDRIKSEPAVVTGAVQAVLGLLLAFGLDLTTEQVGAILAVTAAVLALVVRSQVTPTSELTGNERGAVSTGTLIIIILLVIIIFIMAGVIR